MKLSIIPSVKAGESLTSWLMRTCNENQVKFVNLPIFKSRKKNIDSRAFHKIDFNPESILDINNTCSLFGRDSNFFDCLSYVNISNKFVHKQDLLKNFSQSFLFEVLVIKYRKFCPECLYEDVYFKLDWQFTDLNTCSKHGCKLSIFCPHCTAPQPYYHDTLILGLCSYCGCSLKGKSVYFPCSKKGEEQLHHQLLTLLDPNNNLFFNWGGSSGPSLIHIFLYICTNRSRVFNPHDVQYISRDIKYKLLTVLSTNSAEDNSLFINLMEFLKVLRQQNIDFLELISMEIPISFLISLEAYLKRTQYIKCLSPWCTNFNSDFHLQKYNTRSKTHNNIYHCTKCFLKFGLNKSNNLWEEYGDLIDIGYRKVLPLLLQRQTQVFIAEYVKVSRFKLTKIICYLSQQNLIPIALIDFYLKIDHTRLKEISYTNINIDFKGEVSFVKSLKKSYNLSISEAYYYFFSNNFQNGLLR
ncbi:TniQ family protein [Bacillus sp. E214]|uniref:TniQ family protein n=1 Tax=Bacillus sp. E214 TaxID=2587156 RepID=UPI0011E05723|nr:TniQ family protein [Bacillus sp. E214]